MRLLIMFCSGWLIGMLAEYTYHWVMHRVPLLFHIRHHREFFHLQPVEVAVRARNLDFDFRYAALLMLALSPFIFWWGWAPVFLFWTGVFWHLVILYECSHSIIHYDDWLPRWVCRSRIYRWWKGCHFAHHFHSPTGNYSVTFPPLDWVLGTYVHPQPTYPPLPHPGVKPREDGFTVPGNAPSHAEQVKDRN